MSWPMRVFSDTACGRAKISARIAVATTPVVIAPDLSHACTLYRPACGRVLVASKRSEVGRPRRGSNPARQNLGEKPFQGAPRSSPYQTLDPTNYCPNAVTDP